MTEDRQFITSLERGLKILQFLSRSPGGLTNGELAERTGLARSTISRLIHTLRALDYVTLDASGRRFVLRPKVLTLGYSVLSETTLLQKARPALKKIAEDTGETAALAVRDGLYATFLECARGRSMLAVHMETGARLPMATSAAGLALLKSAPEDKRKRLASRLRSNVIRDDRGKELFKQRLDAALESEIVIVRDTWHKGIGGVAIPVRYNNEVGAITVAVSTAAIDEAAMHATIAPSIIDALDSFQLERA